MRLIEDVGHDARSSPAAPPHCANLANAPERRVRSPRNEGSHGHEDGRVHTRPRREGPDRAPGAVVSPLEGCRTKVARAGDHLESLRLETDRFTDENPWAMIVEADAASGHHLIRLRSRRRPPNDPPIRLSVIVGDVLHNLRSALDHLVWQLVILDGRTPGRGNQFPVYDTAERFSQRGHRDLAGLTPEHQAHIEALQPYDGRDGFLLLRALATLNDMDKHRVVHAALQYGLTGRGTIKFSANVRHATIVGRDLTRFEDGAELYRITSWDHVGGEVTVETRPTYVVAFGDPSGFVVSRGDLVLIAAHVSKIIESFSDDFAEPSRRPR